MLLLNQKSYSVYPDSPPSNKFAPEFEYLKTLLISREADVRESILFRQGRGFFCLPSAGHENMAALAYALKKDDYIYCHYRDRALLLAHGVSLLDMALGYFAKKDSSSAGRQLSSHFSDKACNVVSCASPTASQCLPAVGTAWAIKLEGKKQIVVCCVGEASVRQGEFYEAICFAQQKKLPIVFIVEDNGYGISTPTYDMNPYNLGIFAEATFTKVNGRNALQVHQAMEISAERARNNHGPSVLWITFDRLMSHTSSDDQRLYRAEEELNECNARDPINIIRDAMFNNGTLAYEDWEILTKTIRNEVNAIYEAAENSEEPSYQTSLEDVKSHISTPLTAEFLRKDYSNITYAKAVNETLHHLLEKNKKVVLFGQDIEDPKGGVFGLTKGLSTTFPEQVLNSPLAEATICGTAAGLAIGGFLPIFELQFIDFMATGFNQIMNQIATMRWRTAGQYKCPLILLAPCGGYINGGGPWHTQTNESIFAHIPGLQVYMPSNSMDAASTILSCAAGENPALILLPKQLFYKEFDIQNSLPTSYNQANIVREGNDITLVTWGNCVELSLEAASLLENKAISSEVIDLKTFTPENIDVIQQSIQKTGRLVVIHEDNRTCSYGQAVISQVVSQKSSWDMLYTAPRHVCRDDVLVPFNPILARLSLPSVDRIVAEVKSVLEV